MQATRPSLAKCPLTSGREQPKKPQENEQTEGAVMKTAAQKRQEKKDREREERIKQNQKERARAEREAAVTASSTPAAKDGVSSRITSAAGHAPVTADGEAGKTAAGGKAAKKSGPSAKTSSTSKAVQAAAQERLRLLKEEEERVKRVEEERMRREEEAERARLQAIADEEERKNKKKEKDRLRRERLKAECKPITAKEKAEQAKKKAFLDALRAQGIAIPQTGEKIYKRSAPAKVKRKEVGDDHAVSNKTHATEINNEPVATVVGETDAPAEKGGKFEHSEELIESETASDASATNENVKPAFNPNTVAVAEAPSIKAAPSKKKLTALRSPIVCVLGHVDTGKTKTLDFIRNSHVQDGEAGGITQQIGATEVPLDAIRRQTSMVVKMEEDKFDVNDIRIPGMLIIDTPGHEAFANLRLRGSSLCDIAILVVDLMHGLEKQTIESLNLLKSRNTPFVVALNKIDRLYRWKSMPQTDIRTTIAAQDLSVRGQYKGLVDNIMREFDQTVTNVMVFDDKLKKKFASEFAQAVPTSAVTGDGMGNLIAKVVEFCQTDLKHKLTIVADQPLDCTVMEVKTIVGLGTTIDVILVNGKLRVGDTIVVAGQEGPIVTTIRDLLMPAPLHELRVRNEHFKEVIGAQGLKLLAGDLEKAVAGLPLLVAKSSDEIELHKKELQNQLATVLKSIKVSDRGVYVQASTIGSLEALLQFLRTSKIAFCGINIGPVHIRDVRKAAVMLEHDPKYAVILAFDVPIAKDVREKADELRVRIFSANIIYHLFDEWTKYTDDLRRKAKEEHENKVVFPSRLKILDTKVINNSSPIILPVRVVAGRLRLRTPICIVSKDTNEIVDLGVVTSIQVNYKQIETAVPTGEEVAVRIDTPSGQTPKTFGRHFDKSDELLSHITREGIDLLKEYFRDDMEKSDWQAVIELKKLLNIS